MLQKHLTTTVLSVLSFGAGKVTVIKEIPKLFGKFVKFVGILGEMFGVIALILAFMPKPVLERLRDELARNQRTFIKVTLLDVSPDNRRPSKGKYNIQAFKVEKYPEYINRKIDIYGEKYFLGGFGWLKKTDSWKKLNETLDNFLKKIKENYLKKGNITNNNTKSADNKTKTNNTKSKDNKAKANNTKSADNRTKTNNTKSANNKKDSKNETKNTKSKNNNKKS